MNGCEFVHVYLWPPLQAVVVYDWKQGRMCQSFQGHNREVTKVTSMLCAQIDKDMIFSWVVTSHIYTASGLVFS